MSKYILIVFTILLAFSGCSQSKPVSQNIKPSWTINPNDGGKIGAVGVCSRTHDQKISTQRKLAITRALEELSLQQGVKVQMSIDKKEHVHNDKLNTSIGVESSFQTSNTVTAHVESAWQNESTSELYIWMVMD